MTEYLNILPGADKEEKYRNLIPQLQWLVAGETDPIANVANIVAALWQTFGFFWVGCYFVKGEQLVLGPFQGPVACTRINYGKGVCGTAWEKNEIIVVPDVDLFPGHIACSAESKSEIVCPISDGNKVIGVLDIDSNRKNNFDETDAKWIKKVSAILYECMSEGKNSEDPGK